MESRGPCGVQIQGHPDPWRTALGAPDDPRAKAVPLGETPLTNLVGLALVAIPKVVVQCHASQQEISFIRNV